ncbi:hypothetical protein EGJ00_09480 [Pseudomonas saudiphocaensis]|nr:hypothetical protein EGJ00_09480 [Pseudomonas saudiphocaensis]
MEIIFPGRKLCAPVIAKAVAINIILHMLAMRRSSSEKRGDIDMQNIVPMPLVIIDCSIVKFLVCNSDMETRSHSKLENMIIRDEVKHCSIKNDKLMLLLFFKI